MDKRHELMILLLPRYLVPLTVGETYVQVVTSNYCEARLERGVL